MKKNKNLFFKDLKRYFETTPQEVLDELRKKPHKSSVCGMNCVFFRILFVYF
jgi:hypothetical protein